MEALREELIEAQKARNELSKWKLILVSALGAAGLGFTDLPAVPNAELILCGIPFACAYVDLLFYHEGIEISVIGEFLRSRAVPPSDAAGQLLIEYEKFSWTVRELTDERGRKMGAFDLERFAMSWSSILFSLSIVLYAAIRFAQPTSLPIAVAGIAGTIVNVWVRRSYQARRNAIRNLLGKSKGQART